MYITPVFELHAVFDYRQSVLEFHKKNISQVVQTR